MSPRRSGTFERSWFVLVCGAAAAFALVRSYRLRWTTDDAYISFRYADHLVRGEGLVFNPGERVEGYSNFLWTLWTALGLKVGVEPEPWTIASGLLCYGLTLAALAAFTWNRRAEATRFEIPVAVVGLALHREAAIFATGGLETSLFTLILTVGVLVLVSGELTAGRVMAGGLVFALAVLTRPDGIVPAVLAALWLACSSYRKPARIAVYLGTLAAVLVPYLLWKSVYYGDLLPNTYYAKSAGTAWWSQGATYVGLYFRKYWPLAVGVALGTAALAGGRAAGSGRRALTLALPLSIGFTLYVARVGGDFMFGRFLVPITPLLLVVLEVGLAYTISRSTIRVAAAVLMVGALALPLPTLPPGRVEAGIADEWAQYPRAERLALRRRSEALAAFTTGVPIRIAFFGWQAMYAYTSGARVAIEANAGLTDRFIAHQPLERRGRVGHEKHAPWSYLIEDRRVHFVLGHEASIDRALAPHIPVVHGSLGELAVTLLTWDGPVMAELIRRGGHFPDFVGRLDEFLARLPELPDDQVRTEYAKVRRFYFASTPDAAREQVFRDRLAGVPDQG
jgi:hypothetical protein